MILFQSRIKKTKKKRDCGAGAKKHEPSRKQTRTKIRRSYYSVDVAASVADLQHSD